MTASRIAGKPGTRVSHKKYKNRRPEFESIILGKPKDGLNQAALERLQANISRGKKAADEKGQGTLLDAIHMDLATSIKNDVVTLGTRRLAELVEGVKGEHLGEILAETRKEMRANPEIADSIPKVILNAYRMTGGKIRAKSLIKMTRGGFSHRIPPCPEIVSQAMKKDYDAGRMDNIQGVAEVRKEQLVTAQIPLPAIQAASTQQPHDTQPTPQPALQSISKPQEVRTEPCMGTQTKSQLSPLQVWEEVRKIREGEKRPQRKQFTITRVREKPADKGRTEPPQAAPARITKLEQPRPVPASVHAKPAAPVKDRKPPEKKRDLPPTATLETAPAPAQASAETKTLKDEAFHVHRPLIIPPDQEKKPDDDDKPGPSDKFAGGMGLKAKRGPKKKKSGPRTRREPNASETKKKPKKKEARRKAKKIKKAKKKAAVKAKPKAKRRPRKKPKARKKAKARKETKARLKPKKNSKVKKGRRKRKAAKKRLSAKRKKAMKAARKRKPVRKRKKMKASTKTKKAGQKLIRRFRTKKKRRRRRKAA